MTKEQAEQLIKALRDIRFVLIVNVGFGLTLAIGAAAMSIAIAISHLK